MRKLMLPLAFLIMFAFLLYSNLREPSGAGEDFSRSKLIKASLPFIENVGQLPQEVEFYANTFAGTVFVTERGEIVYSLPAGKDKGMVIRESFPSHGQVRGIDRTEAVVNIFKGSRENWRRNVPTYRSVSLGEIAKGIELRLKAYGNQVEKLFYVKPGANPENIRIKVEGGQRLEINAEGELVVKTELGDVKFTRPVAFQEIDGKKKYVEVSYALLDKDTYTFRVGKYDRTKTLVIDPLLASTYLGGSLDDLTRDPPPYYYVDMAIDQDGNIYVTGTTFSNDFPVTTGAYQTTFGGTDGYWNGDGFIAKFSPDLTQLLAATYIGGSRREYISSIEIFNNFIYVGGTTTSSDFLPNPDAVFLGDPQTSNFRIFSSFVLKMDINLSNILASLFFGFGTHIQELKLDQQGNVYITGLFRSYGNIPFNQGAPQTTFAGGIWDVYVAKISADFSRVLGATLLGGSNDEHVVGMDIDNQGNIYIAGFTRSNDFPITQGTVDNTFEGVREGFIAKIHSDFLGWTITFLGGSGSDMVFDIMLDSSGNIYAVGYTESQDFPTTQGAFQQTYGGFGDGFVIKLSNNLQNILASTFIGGSSSDAISTLTIDNSGNIVVGGYTSSDDYPVTQGAYQFNKKLGIDTVISKFDANLENLLASTYFGGNSSEQIWSIAVDGANNIVVYGYTWSTDLPTTQGAFSNQNSGQEDMFVAILDPQLSTTAPQINSFTSDVSSGVAPLTVTFSWSVSDPGGDALTCTLDPGDGTNPYTISDCVTNTSQTHTYSRQGTYNAVLTVTDANGASVSATVTITVSSPVNDPPVINSFSVSPNIGEAPLTVTFTWNVSDPNGDTLTCQLDVDNDGTADYTINDCVSNTSQTHTYSSAGTYTAVLTVDDGNGGTASQNLQVTVNEPQTSTNRPPVINSFSAEPSSGEAPLTVTFSWSVSDPDGDSLTCSIDVDGDGSSDYTVNACEYNSSLQHTYQNSGTFSVSIRVEDGNGNTVTETIRVSVSEEDEQGGGCASSGSNYAIVLLVLSITYLLRRILKM